MQLVNSQSPNEKLAPFISNLIAPDVALAHGLPIEFFWSGDKSSGRLLPASEWVKRSNFPPKKRMRVRQWAIFGSGYSKS